MTSEALAQTAFETSSCASAAQLRCFADVFVTFEGARPSLSRSHNPWLAQSGADRGNRLWIDAPSEISATLWQACHAGPWRTWLFGELFDYRDGGYGTALQRFSADLRDGTARPQDLNGRFILIAHDERDSSWHAWTDRLGTLHLYYSTSDRPAIGTFYPAVAAAASRRMLDWRGLSGWCSLGFFPEDRTFFDDVRIVRPATHVAWDRTGRKTHESRYWSWWHRPDTSRNYDETIEEFGETLATIVRTHVASGPVAIPLSGGLDSRTVAAVVTDRNQATAHALWSYSYGYLDGSQETAIASGIARARRLPFRSYTIPPYVFDRLDTILDSVEGFAAVTTPRQAAVVDEIAAHADHVLAAHWGDVWMDDAGVDDSVHTDQDLVSHAVAKMRKRGGERLMDLLVTPHLGDEPPEQLVRSIVASELRRIAGIEDTDFRVKAFKTEQWSFRWTVAGLRMYQAAAFPRLPFYDNRMVDFCCTVPTEFVRGRRLQIDYLKRHHPDLASITWQETDSSLFSRQYFNSWQLPKRAAKKLARLATGKRRISRNWEVQFFGPGARQRLEAHLLSSGLKLHDLMPVAEVRNLVNEMYAGPTASNGHAVSQLLTFSACLERYA